MMTKPFEVLSRHPIHDSIVELLAENERLQAAAEAGTCHPDLTAKLNYYKEQFELERIKAAQLESKITELEFANEQIERTKAVDEKKETQDAILVTLLSIERLQRDILKRIGDLDGRGD